MLIRASKFNEPRHGEGLTYTTAPVEWVLTYKIAPQ
jgi:hypothetical protein